MAPTRLGAEALKKRRGRPPKFRPSDATRKSAHQLGTTKKHTKRNRASRTEGDDELAGEGRLEAQKTHPRKRKAQPEADELAGAEIKSRKKYVQLETKTRRIPQEQIDTWPQISSQVLSQIEAVLREAKKDIANTQRDERRIITAHNTLNPLVRKLGRQLAAARIPPQAKDIHFNIEKLTERNAQVSREVTSARHSKQLLTEQVRVAEHLLKKDEENLEQLKKAAKTWRTEWKHQEKHGRVHPLLQDPEQATIYSDSPDDIGLKRSTPTSAASLDAPDDALNPVLEQLQRSLENMQGSHTHVAGIDGAIREAQAALDDVLSRHMSARQYAAM
ncbi:CENP-Q, a CENPA-CAD centromere complex subunit-domain-containing protein [Phaeosphaeria sp. MPI-PUGE-AT-0046c]|nr:CENP-Q, a CENPA-CAD centromere complex subunit-domain-containing protein [Phaeosphaeria sp. MPI-PUGE-AT-0046c]